MSARVRTSILRALPIARYFAGELRPFTDQVDARRIDWPATARTGKLQVRLSTDAEVTWTVLVDSSASMRCGKRLSPKEASIVLTTAWTSNQVDGDRSARIRANDLNAALQKLLKTSSPETALLLITDLHGAAPIDQRLLALLKRHCDCTALIAENPWRADLPLRGFVRIRDSESGKTAAVFISNQERRRFAQATLALQQQVARQFRRARWRIAFFLEENPRGGLTRAFAG